MEYIYASCCLRSLFIRGIYVPDEPNKLLCVDLNVNMSGYKHRRAGHNLVITFINLDIPVMVFTHISEESHQC